MSKAGTLYLVPVPIAEQAFSSLSREIYHHTSSLQYYFVENIRTSRRFLRALHPDLGLESIHFSEIGKHADSDEALFLSWLQQGHDVGIMSEAGCPGIADPGAALVNLAHRHQIRVVPLTGPNSLLLALMASGLNGQHFAFRGYLPVKEPMRGKEIKRLETYAAEYNQTQIFIETPYRNNALFQDLLKYCKDTTRLCLAQDMTAPSEYIRTLTVRQWKTENMDFTKSPMVFLLLP